MTGLLGAVERFHQAGCHPRWGCLAWYVDVDWHFRVHEGLEIRGFYVHDFVLEVVLGAMRHLNTKSCHLAHAGVRLNVIDPKTLAKTLCDEPSFKSVDESIRIGLDLEDVLSVDR